MDQEIITRYIGQPARLPRELRARIEHACSGSSIQLYALADLDHTLRLSESWLALTADHVALARRDESGEWCVRVTNRGQIDGVQETPALSAHTLSLLGEPGDPPLLVVRYTHRQRGAFENIRFVLDEALTAVPSSPRTTSPIACMPQPWRGRFATRRRSSPAADVSRA